MRDCGERSSSIKGELAEKPSGIHPAAVWARPEQGIE
jgi:hypothetical protein